MEEYDNYIKFIREISEEGISQSPFSGIDETTLFYYYSKYKKEKEFFRICQEFLDIPWDVPWESKMDGTKKITDVYSYNYLSYVKPWKKAKFIAWEEEHLWSDIYQKMKKTKTLKKLHQETIKDGLKEFFSYNNDFKAQKRYYNLYYKKNYSNELNSLNSENLTFDDIVNMEVKLNLNKKNKKYGMLNEQKIKNLFKDIKNYKNKKTK
jgi:hypothetical protein